MKKIISNFLTVLMLFGMLSSFSVFAEEAYPPLETGAHTGFSDYEFETAGDNPTPITLNESSDMQFYVRDNPLPLNDENLINQIKEDYVTFTSNEYTVEQIDVLYYGTLSDGSIILYMDVPAILMPAFENTVIGKYVYITPNKHDGMVLYKDHQFKEFDDAYLDGSLTDELLDELAVKLSFAKFVNPNEQKTQGTTASVDSTPDTAPNNSNGSIPTGHSNIIILLAVAILGISFVALCLAKSKRAL